MSLPTRKIGSSDVPYPGLGCMSMTAFYSPHLTSEERNHAVLKTAFDAGCRHWDTANVYTGNEVMLGNAIKVLGIDRSDLFLATKFGLTFQDGNLLSNGKPDYVRSCLEQSLKSLQTDYIDLYYLHRVDANTPIEETVTALKEAQDAGKISHIGLSECSAATLRRASKVAKIAAVQVEYSMWETFIETSGVLDACKELGVAVVAYSPLGRGLLTGQIKSRSDIDHVDARLTMPRFSEENFPKNLELVEMVKAFAAKKGCTPGQLALAWVHAQWDDILAIPGTTRVEAVKENISSAHVRLSHVELAKIRMLLTSFTPSGDRYNAQMAALTNI
ncbi:Aldo/keto reductase [Calocera cornea HHB12733]|uniref:Aldo/keto reductase n=1 Tax=Calocera cornea HHB12733 TaxID=1353952 RepID=A0A165CUS8_9BASI|nr:Aldo/keto reductase [Calocera cornea HHB12733]